MKRFSMYAVMAALLCFSFIGTALANEKNLKKTLTLTEDVMINDTLVKKGTYRVMFNAKAQEVTLSVDGKAVYTGKATVESLGEKAKYNSSLMRETEKGKRLDRFTFQGDDRAVVLLEKDNKANVGE